MPCALGQSLGLSVNAFAVQELTGFFVAPLTGVYEWFVSGGDSIDLAMDEGSGSLQSFHIIHVANRHGDLLQVHPRRHPRTTIARDWVVWRIRQDVLDSRQAELGLHVGPA